MKDNGGIGSQIRHSINIHPNIVLQEFLVHLGHERQTKTGDGKIGQSRTGQSFPETLITDQQAVILVVCVKKHPDLKCVDHCFSCHRILRITIRFRSFHRHGFGDIKRNHQFGFCLFKPLVHAGTDTQHCEEHCRQLKDVSDSFHPKKEN